MGVTTALAWALPDQPQYISEYLQEQYANGTLPLLDRNDNDVASLTYSAPANEKKPSTSNNGYDSYYGTSKRKNYYDSYYTGNPLQRNDHDPASDNGILNEIHKYSSKPYQPWRQTDWSLSDSTKHNNNYYARRPSSRQTPALRVYQALGKRSVDVATSFEDIFYFNHHRDTRHDLYRVIEKYLEA